VTRGGYRPQNGWSGCRQPGCGRSRIHLVGHYRLRGRRPVHPSSGIGFALGVVGLGTTELGVASTVAPGGMGEGSGLPTSATLEDS
jgi:hypothetical protein